MAEDDLSATFPPGGHFSQSVTKLMDKVLLYFMGLLIVNVCQSALKLEI